ncbi:hypothetical protein ASD51_10020 [Streptomyces sp. Root55]|uniref:hypothetical protein n=1 Tax=Streptomyces clavifer TaxID=68188 RepID=UPI0006F9F6EB|nr:hypothetical protein [Streptomyces clavifer]KQX77537.1 hypothetical protein ASD26_14970 [Streptomyces sp. Root1319]KQZ10563.1 hypothetical protein ASD51_10020 [Streptomyces sp. Root55]
MSRAVLVTAGSSPTSTPSNRLVTTTVAAVAPGATPSPRCPRHSGTSVRIGMSSSAGRREVGGEERQP